MSSTATLLDEYSAGIDLPRRSVAGMNAEQLLASPISGAWSTLQVICHLVDSEQTWCQRFKRTIAEERPLLIGYDETRFAATLRYQERDVETELRLFEDTRKQMAGILRGLPEGAWKRQGVHNEQGLMTLEQMVRVETDHISHHLRHILKKRAALGLSTEI